MLQWKMFFLAKSYFFVKIACIQHYNNSTYLYFDLDLIFHNAKITLLQKSEM